MEDSKIIENVSKVFLKFANEKVGCESLVRHRREFLSIGHELNEIKNSGICPHKHVYIGTFPEGLWLITSDQNMMLVYENINIVQNIVTDDISGRDEAVLLIEADQTRPGFCLLRLISRTGLAETGISSSLVKFQNGFYLSSTLWNNVIRIYHPHPQRSTLREARHYFHGEGEITQCLKYKKWPLSAEQCIQRLRGSGWPPINVLSDIVQSGCHLEPVGDTVSVNQTLEWRITFPEAEKALVCEMNHCQFLCYGIFNIFFKEVINTREDISGMLSSYIIKTTILWELLYNRRTWLKQDFLKLIWNCFRRLLSFVKIGHCPNFFIPENNLLLGKINVRTQQLLLQHLTSLYNEGYRCLPCCKCVSCWTVLFHPQRCSFGILEDRCDKLSIDTSLLSDRENILLSSDNISTLHRRVTFLELIRMHNKSQTCLAITDFFLHFQTQYLLFCTALRLLTHSYSGSNKITHLLVCKFVKAFKNNRFDLFTHEILSAMLFYKLGMHQDALSKALKLRLRVQHTYIIYPWTLDLNEYKAAGGEYIPVGDMMRKHYMKTLTIHESMCLPELLLEHQSCGDSLEYPPLVMVYILLFLCYHRLTMHREADSVLTDLMLLINSDNGHHIPAKLRGISLDILERCQALRGNIDEANTSYTMV